MLNFMLVISLLFIFFSATFGPLVHTCSLNSLSIKCDRPTMSSISFRRHKVKAAGYIIIVSCKLVDERQLQLASFLSHSSTMTRWQRMKKPRRTRNSSFYQSVSNKTSKYSKTLKLWQIVHFTQMIKIETNRAAQSGQLGKRNSISISR